MHDRRRGPGRRRRVGARPGRSRRMHDRRRGSRRWCCVGGRPGRRRRMRDGWRSMERGSRRRLMRGRRAHPCPGGRLRRCSVLHVRLWRRWGRQLGRGLGCSSGRRWCAGLPQRFDRRLRLSRPRGRCHIGRGGAGWTRLRRRGPWRLNGGKLGVGVHPRANSAGQRRWCRRQLGVRRRCGVASCGRRRRCPLGARHGQRIGFGQRGVLRQCVRSRVGWPRCRRARLGGWDHGRAPRHGRLTLLDQRRLVPDGRWHQRGGADARAGGCRSRGLR